MFAFVYIHNVLVVLALSAILAVSAVLVVSAVSIVSSVSVMSAVLFVSAVSIMSAVSIVSAVSVVSAVFGLRFTMKMEIFSYDIVNRMNFTFMEGKVCELRFENEIQKSKAAHIDFLKKR